MDVFTFKYMAENLQKKHLPFVIHIPGSKGNVKVFCNIIFFCLFILVSRNFVEFCKGEFKFVTLLTLWRDFSIYQALQHFFLKNISPFALFFSVIVLYLVLWNEQRIFFPGYGCHGIYFAISMATVVKGKNVSVCFRRLMWTSIHWEFQLKATIISWDKMLHSVPLFSINRALDHSDRYLMTKRCVKFYDFLIYRCLWWKNPSGTFIFSFYTYGSF